MVRPNTRVVVHRLRSSLFVAAVIMLCVFVLPGLLSAPRQALSIIASEPGRVLSGLAALLLVFGLPAWIGAFVILSLLGVGRRAGEGTPASAVGTPRGEDSA